MARTLIVALVALAIGAGAGSFFAGRRAVHHDQAAPAAAPVGEAASATLPGIVTIAGPAMKRVNQLPTGPLYWQVETFPNMALAKAAETATGVVIEAEHKAWLFTLTKQGERSPGATHLVEIGPVPIGSAPEYLLQIAEQTRAPGNVGSVHSHPGVESWYVVAGEQGLRLPAQGKELRAGAGQGMVGPPANEPMQVINLGGGERRAFNIFVLDASKPTTKEAADVRSVDEEFKRTFEAGNIDATMELFADETVQISPFGVFPGKAAIRGSVETFIRTNPGFKVTFDKSDYVQNTAVHKVSVTSDPIRASGVSRFILIHTVVVVRGKIAMLGQQLDLNDVETARYSLALAPEGR